MLPDCTVFSIQGVNLRVFSIQGGRGVTPPKLANLFKTGTTCTGKTVPMSDPICHVNDVHGIYHMK